VASPCLVADRGSAGRGPRVRALDSYQTASESCRVVLKQGADLPRPLGERAGFAVAGPVLCHGNVSHPERKHAYQSNCEKGCPR
jgi:hypothetical protein